jgi:hypothetical protein
MAARRILLAQTLPYWHHPVLAAPHSCRDALRFLFVAASLAFALTSTPTIDTKPNETEQVICIDRLANNKTLCPQAERLENVLKSTIQIMILSRALGRTIRRRNINASTYIAHSTCRSRKAASEQAFSVL